MRATLGGIYSPYVQDLEDGRPRSAPRAAVTALVFPSSDCVAIAS